MDTILESVWRSKREATASLLAVADCAASAVTGNGAFLNLRPGFPTPIRRQTHRGLGVGVSQTNAELVVQSLRTKHDVSLTAHTYMRKIKK